VKIVLRFSARDTVGSGLIQWRTGCWASHVEIELSDGKCLGSRYPRGVDIYEPFPDYARLERYEYEGSEAVLNFMLSQRGKPYDRSAIFGFVVNRDWQEDDSWYCAEVIERANALAGCALVSSVYANVLWPRDQLFSAGLRRLM
jgi:hypothetical protein